MRLLVYRCSHCAYVALFDPAWNRASDVAATAPPCPMPCCEVCPMECIGETSITLRSRSEPA